MNTELIKINYDAEQATVSARDLHEGLKIKSNFTTWFERMCEYGFDIEKDFFPKKEESTGGRPAQDFDVAVSMAKEICMIQRSPEGKQYRQYFITLETAWNTPEQVMARALKMADKQISELQSSNITLLEDNKQMKPKALFADAVAGSSTSILIGDLAKILNQNGIDIGQNRLFEWLRTNKFLYRSSEDNQNRPYQRYVDSGLFEIEETVIYVPDKDPKIRLTTKVTGKGQQYFINKFLEEKNSVGGVC